MSTKRNESGKKKEYSCNNLNREVGYYMVQDGWINTIVNDIFTRIPKLINVRTLDSVVECRYEKNSVDPRCIGCRYQEN